MSIQQLEKEAMQLPEKERANLAQKLLESLSQDFTRIEEEALLAELRRRQTESLTDKDNLIPAKDAIQTLRARFS